MAANFAVSTAFRAVDNVSSAFIRMGKSAEAFGNKSKSAFGKASSAGLTFKGVIGGILGANIIQQGFQVLKQNTIGAIMQVAELGDTAFETSQKIGISAEAFQELSFAAKQSGASSESLVNAFSLLNRNIADLKIGQGSLASTLVRTNLGLGKQLYNVKNNEQAFNILVDAISKSKDPFKRAQLAQAAFSKGAKDILPLIMSGSEGIKKLREEAIKNGRMTNAQAKAAGDFKDNVDSLKNAFLGLQITLISDYFPAMQKLVEQARVWIIANREMIKTNVKAFFEGTVTVIKILIPILQTGYNLFVKYKDILLIVAGAYIAVNLATKVWLATLALMPILKLAKDFAFMVQMTNLWRAAIWLFNAAWAANPIGLIVAGVAALGVGVYYLAKNWDSVTNAVKSAWEWISKIFGLGLDKIAMIFGFGSDRENTTASRQAPNATEVQRQSIQVGGTFNFANAPKGSSFTPYKTNRNLDYRVLGAN